MKSENQSESVDNLSKSISSRESRFSEQSSVSYENYNGSSSFLSKENENDAENDEMEVLLPLRLSHLESAVHLIRGRLCREHAKRVLEAFRQRKMWAMHMYDSSAKMADGVLAGSVYQMGNYDECVSVRAPPIRGQYCLTEISLNINNTQSNILTEKQVLRTSRDTLLRWAVCVPATCSARDVERLLRALTVHLRDTDAPSLRVRVPSRMCSAVHDSMPPVTLLQVIYGCTIVSFLLLVSTATIFHGVRTILGSDDVTKKASLFCQIIVCFSLMQNVRKIVSIPRENELKLDCIAGIRFLAMVFVICGHSLVFIVSGPILNDKFYNNAITKIENAFLLNNPLLVDTFLFLSGFLLCRLLFPELSVHKKKSQKGGLLAALYIGRYIRLTPAYAAVLGLYCTWLERIGDGPLWTSKIIPEHNRCKISWWTNLLYINNYIHTDNLCMFQSWYLSVDTQLYILAPLVIYPLWKWPKIGRYLLGLVTLTFIALPGILTYVNNLDPTLMAYALEVRDLSTNSYFINVYIKTHMRASAYCIGLLFGYIVYLIQTNKVNIKSTWAHSCSILSMIIGLGSMFSVIVFYQPNHYASNIENALYNALSRVGWCLAIGWLIIACITDNGGFVQRFLCWKPFQPLSRLTYCAYLVNGLVVLHASASVRNPQYMSVYSLFCHCSAHIVITFGLALIICLLFESPIHGLEKILMQKFNKKPVNIKESVPVNAVSVTTIQVG